ncbi:MULTISPECIES: phage tail spike protein [unclassified Oceanobacillus]|uniref:phage tail spike protein n=1 Tax=unclassified Oceanobacillus TaxID=2630292 RepID=UPI001BEC8604|nr:MULTISPECIES: phage tail spike protein [unclassified Oceanobacillus]MBT2599080.1 phage tail protein [Oceanobacillus sp. ISL-74]MBT2651998.1 phage tail protein [Oceanobacillus sp. ISL-73]
MSQIHILDGQENIILDYITAKNIISDLHKKSLEDTLETYDFITFANRRFSQYLEKRNRIIIPDEDGTLVEFVIFEAAKYKDTEGHKAQVYTNASYLELKKAAIIYPESFKGSPSQHTGRALNNTGWKVGKIEGTGSRTIIVENHTNPYEILKRIAREFELELKFRIEHDGNKVTGRYVDLLERVGQWRGREVEFGKDLDGIRRVEKQDVVTALLGIGPEMEDGSRIEVLVEDEDALRRWGEVKSEGGLRHLIEPYEIQSERTEMTEDEVRQYTRTALNKRIDTQVTYETTIIDLESVPGMENKKIRFGDTIRIKDTSFNPPLYLEARVFEQTRSIKFVGKKDIKLGDFVEFTEEQVNDVWKQLQQQIQRRVTQYEMHEYTYEKIMIDQKDQTVFDEGKTFAEAIGIESKNYSDSQDAVVRVELEGYSDRIAEQYAESALEQAKMYAVSQEFYEAQMENIVRDISDRAPIEYVDGEIRVIKEDLDDFDAKLEQKADGSTVYTISQVDTMLNNKVSVTQYTEDMEGVVRDLESYGTRIGQNAEAIGLKADDTRLDTVEENLNTKIGNLEVKADEVVISVQEVRADLNHKVDGVYVADAIDGIQVGGRNLYIESQVEDNTWIPSSGIVEPNSAYKTSDFIDVRGYSHVVFNKFRDDGHHRIARYDENYNLIGNRLTSADSVFVYKLLEGMAFIRISVLKDWTEYKIEKGNKATDWTPAPEDTDAQFSDVYGRVETLDASIETMAGQIELKASQSVVDSLTGDVETLEAELRILPDTITLDASRINFDGHVFGSNATFDGTIQGAVINGSRIVNEYSSSGEQRRVVFDQGEMEYWSSLYGEESTVSILGDQIVFSGRSGSGRIPSDYFDTIERFNLFTHGLVTRPKTSGGESTFFIGAKKVGIGDPTLVHNSRTAGGTLELNRINFIPDDGLGSDEANVYLDVYGELVIDGVINNAGHSINTHTIYAGNYVQNGGNYIYLGSNSGVRVTDTNTYQGSSYVYKPIRASSFPTGTSLRENKTDIEVFNYDALTDIKNANPYLYRMKNEEYKEYKQLGLMVDETPYFLHGETGDSMEMYALNTFLWRGMQQLDNKVEREISELKTENQFLHNELIKLKEQIA